ncbi:hypothetical protein BTHERMOSOX_1068 [Bathymodiolus thermophilus thioautotrophic gill symbiont]|uniref:Uncharacterized protein n=1 Tax=Bathymodiolus thermophilus thioautotrophic gill symbiont TaxID=2360 RepID=A0A8H8XD21_9GAMM|nr:hypothetical protein THERMOS_246 [Bathymodiolus thermophilus thioautotrophic gill symbiont]CAB5502177.1 hypothetical protein THERMOT_1568 [Bathymodiolus thermophilus thioautotrophic gill symbiont]SGZ70113.1 hypothetical protein BTHERMOSOX_1068 [Bathymodiolus thermophilus thioautotrophic gill symbiont]
MNIYPHFLHKIRDNYQQFNSLFFKENNKFSTKKTMANNNNKF